MDVNGGKYDGRCVVRTAALRTLSAFWNIPNVCHFHTEEVLSPQESSLASGLHQLSRAMSVCLDGTTCYLMMSDSHGCCLQRGSPHK
ncbi:hypothetical protein AALO_G00097800 [Alosa alosa]|uniref:Uncharacterized protein n=1 Tax=Alosa alosa TaxID=278164 RepID=A0AAV6GT85_9TELE|nr:hypothetical protein AALO_G00097800 [Alosa alosa]